MESISDLIWEPEETIAITSEEPMKPSCAMMELSCGSDETHLCFITWFCP